MGGARQVKEKKELKLFLSSALGNWVDELLKKTGLILWILLDNSIDGHKEYMRRSRFGRGVVAKSVIDMLSVYGTLRRK